MTPDNVNAMSSELDQRARALAAQVGILASGRVERADRIAALVEELVSNARLVEANRPELLAETALIWENIATYTRLRNVTAVPASAVSADNLFAGLVGTTDADPASDVAAQMAPGAA